MIDDQTTAREREEQAEQAEQADDARSADSAFLERHGAPPEMTDSTSTGVYRTGREPTTARECALALAASLHDVAGAMTAYVGVLEDRNPNGGDAGRLLVRSLDDLRQTALDVADLWPDD